MCLVARAEYAQQVEEADQGDVARHDDSNALWALHPMVAAEPPLQRIGLQHIGAYSLHGTLYVGACEPCVLRYGIIYDG